MSPIDVQIESVGGSSAAQPYSGALTRYVAAPGFLRLDIEIVGGDAYVQISERIEYGYWGDTGEMLLREGTHSIPLARRAYGWRARSASATIGVTFNARTVG